MILVHIDPHNFFVAKKKKNKRLILYLMWKNKCFSFRPALSSGKKRYAGKNQSLYRPWRFQETEAPSFKISAHQGGEVVSRTHRRVGPMAIMPAEELCQRRIPMTPLGNEPVTFRLVAQCINELRHRAPYDIYTYTHILVRTTIGHCNI